MEDPNTSERVCIANFCSNLQIDKSAVADLFEILDKQGSFDAPAGELSIAFVSKEEIARMHGEFMDDPTPTDVITFFGEPDVDLAGEICVCPEVAQEYAAVNQLDFSRELTLYLVHGYLHLAGFDDIEDKHRTEMRKAEQIAMDLVEKNNAAPRFEISSTE